MRFILFLSGVVVGLSFISVTAQAAGYSCVSMDREMRTVVYFAASDNSSAEAPSVGPAQKLVFIDPTLKKRSQEVVSVKVDNGALNTEAVSARQRFTVVLTPDDVPHPGKNLGGTKVGLLSSIVLDVQVSELAPKVEGATYSGEVSYLKKTGELFKEDFDCAVFLGDDAPVFDL